MKKDLIELASQCNQDETDRYILVITEFRDEFNPYNGNNINKSILLHILTIIPINSTVDSSEFTYLIAISHKHKDNIINKTTYIESLNRLV